MQQRTPEQIEDVLQFREETIDAVMLPHERGQQPTVEETVEEGRLFLHERVRQPIVRVSVEMGRLAPQERVQQRSAEKMVVVLQTPEETVEVGRLVPHERGQQPTVEETFEGQVGPT